jgi:hypothetical protein
MFRTTRSALSAIALVAGSAAAQQPIDSAYTAKIKEYLRDARITTELVDHLPASSTVPTPLKFHGRIVGTPGELTYSKDINRYLEAIAKAAPNRARYWVLGKSEEGRDMGMFVVADEATIRELDKHKANIAALTDPRKTTEAQAKALIPQTKPIYWLTSGMHSTETGGPEMLQELAYRLVVEETPFIQNIRANVITMITPVIEPDGREKQVDTYYFNKKRETGDVRLPLMYWGKYVAHDNNRDHIGQFLALSKNVTKHFLEWHPVIMHDLHEAQTYLYASTGTGPYNEAIDAITVDEWWILAKNDVSEMTKRGVPGVWTYGFYDGWTPNYMFFAAHAHNATGRFYEVQSYGPDTTTVRSGATVTSREWFRPNPPLPSIAWGPRNNTNIQESAVLFALSHVAKNRDMYLENYWLKNKRAIARADNGTAAWVLPAGQRRKGEVADVVNSLRFQGLEFHRANADFKAGNVDVKAGDYIIRGDQPYRTIGDMYFSFQSFAPQNPRPYDDTGWTYQLLRNVSLLTVSDKSILSQPMTAVTSDVKAPGGVEGTGSTIVVNNNSDNNLVTLRFKLASTKMSAAEEQFSVGSHQFSAGSLIIPNANRPQIDALTKDLGLTAVAVETPPTVKSHDLDVPRIGYVHSWANTQNEGWVRAALDTYGVPYTYFADQRLRDGNLRAKYDVIIIPHIGGNAQQQVGGIPKNGKNPLPYMRTAATPNLGALDQSPDIRGGMGVEGLMELYKFVQAGGTLITEGSTATLFPEYGMTSGITIEPSTALFARGSIFRGRIADKKSPIVYGYEGDQMPVYFNQDPVISVAAGGGGGGFGGGGGLAGQLGQNTTPMATRVPLSVYEGPVAAQGNERGGRGRGAAGDSSATGGGGGGGGGGFGGQGTVDPMTRPRVVMQFPADTTQMLLSGTLAGARVLSNRAQIVDAPVGAGHVVMFAIRPYWRWQTQGTYMLGFNAIMNWNDLDAGRAAAPGAAVRAAGTGNP